MRETTRTLLVGALAFLLASIGCTPDTTEGPPAGNHRTTETPTGPSVATQADRLVERLRTEPAGNPAAVGDAVAAGAEVMRAILSRVEQGGGLTATRIEALANACAEAGWAEESLGWWRLPGTSGEVPDAATRARRLLGYLDSLALAGEWEEAWHLASVAEASLDAWGEPLPEARRQEVRTALLAHATAAQGHLAE